MTHVLVFRHGDGVPLGLLGEALENAGMGLDEVALHEGEQIPPLGGYSALVVLGGEMGAYDEDEYPWLRAEKEAIEEAYRLGMPMLGICLGSQLFAEALGGDAYLADGPPEIGHFTPELTDDGRSDPVLRHFDEPVCLFHQDTFEVPPDATVLARSDRFPQAFRKGSAVAIQAHPEADTHIVRGWVAKESSRRKMVTAGIEPDALVAAVAEGEADQREMASRLFGAWIREVRSQE